MFRILRGTSDVHRRLYHIEFNVVMVVVVVVVVVVMRMITNVADLRVGKFILSETINRVARVSASILVAPLSCKALHQRRFHPPPYDGPHSAWRCSLEPYNKSSRERGWISAPARIIQLSVCAHDL